MISANENKINNYVDNIMQSRCIGGKDTYYKELSEHILEKYNINNPLTNKVINYVEREAKRIKQNLNPTIKNDDRIKLVNYLNAAYVDTNNLLNKYLKKVVEDNIINFGFIDSITPYFCLTVIIEKIIKNFHILNLYEKDCKNLIKEKRDKQKIINAIDTIQAYTTDKHLLYELEIEKESITHVNKTLLLSSFFYDFTSIIEKLFKADNRKLSISKTQSLANEIMYNVFDVNKDYRITKHITSIIYKNYVLYRYYYNQEMDKRIAFSQKKYSLK